MVTATVREARLHLSRFLHLVENGQEVVIRNRTTPIARLVPYEPCSSGEVPDLTAFRASLIAEAADGMGGMLPGRCEKTGKLDHVQKQQKTIIKELI